MFRIAALQQAFAPQNQLCILRIVGLVTGDHGGLALVFWVVPPKCNKCAALRSLEHDPQKWNPLLRQGHAQALNLAHILVDQAIPPDRNML
jgi:hypothetical protein